MGDGTGDSMSRTAHTLYDTCYVVGGKDVGTPWTTTCPRVRLPDGDILHLPPKHLENSKCKLFVFL